MYVMYLRIDVTEFAVTGFLSHSDEDETLGGLYEAPPAPPAVPSKRIASPQAHEFSTPKRKHAVYYYSV